MNILFDQTMAQAKFYTGAAEYAQSLFMQMLLAMKAYPDVRLYSLYSSAHEFRYETFRPDRLKGHDRVLSVDYHGKTLKQVIKENEIDLLFVTCAQWFCVLPLGDLSGLGCKVVVVIHDLCDEELQSSKIEYTHYMEHPWQFMRNCLSRIKGRMKSVLIDSQKDLMRKLIEGNDTDIITVSDYSKNSIEYFYPSYAEKIHVFYSPMKVCPEEKSEIDNETLRNIIREGKKYFLLLSANRITKNGERMLNAFRRYVEITGYDALIVTTGCQESLYKQHVALPYLSSSDVDNAFRHCHALLYPSLFEGFGYPPVEAMRFDKPVLSSNVCSMPEILEEAPIYFSPIYESSMYRALQKFTESDYSTLQKQVREQYKKISERQQTDLQQLAIGLLNGAFK